MAIRVAQLKDAEVLAEAERQIARQPGRLASTPEEIKVENVRERIAALGNDPRARFVVLEEEGALLGHASLEPLKLAVTAHVVVLSMAVHEGHQGRGIGQRLLEHLIEWAREHSEVEKIELQVRSSNRPAIQLYQKLGFREEGRKSRRIKLSGGEYLDDLYLAMWVGL